MHWLRHLDIGLREAVGMHSPLPVVGSVRSFIFFILLSIGTDLQFLLPHAVKGCAAEDLMSQAAGPACSMHV